MTLDSVEDVRGRGSLAREYTITYRGALAPNETRDRRADFWDASPSAQPEVSIEQSIRDRFRIQIGDTMRFDVLGRPIEARVTSVRTVDWRDVRNGGFMFVFRPGTFDQAPHGFIASMRGPADGDQRARLQRDLVTAFPNVSVIDLREVLETARSMIGTITLGVTVVGSLVLATGVLILTGAVAMTKFRRVYRGRDPQDARRQHAHRRQLAAAGVRPAGTAGGNGGLAGRHRVELRDQPLGDSSRLVDAVA